MGLLPRSGAAVAALTLVVVLAVSACSGGGESVGPVPPAGSQTSATSTPVNPYERDRADGVQRLLNRYTSALVDGDREVLGELVDPAAPQWLRDSVAAAAGNFETLRLKDFRYQLAPTVEAEQPIDPALQERVDAQGSSDSWLAPVELHFALGGPQAPGIDEAPVTLNVQMVVARYGDEWRLVDVLDAPQQLWDIPDLSVASTPTAGGESVIASYPGAQGPADIAQAELAAAVTAVSRFWGTGWAQRAVVVATGSDEQFGALVGFGDAESAQVGAAAATTYVHLGDDATGPVGQRIILTPSAIELDAAALGVVLRHELFHVAARATTAATAPMWLTEGVAEYVGRIGTYRRFEDAAPDLAASIRQFGTPEALPGDSDFGGEQSQLAYQSAWSVAAFLADRFDEERLRTVYGVVGGAPANVQEAAIDAALGMTSAALVTEWRRWLDDQVR